MPYLKYGKILIFRIFDGIVSPILLYNSEVWGVYGNNDLTKWDKTIVLRKYI
jgi:hypothetical protein